MTVTSSGECSPAPSVPPICCVCRRIIPTYSYETGPHGPYHQICSGERSYYPQPMPTPLPVYPEPFYPWQPWGQPWPGPFWYSPTVWCGTTGTTGGVTAGDIGPIGHGSTTGTFGTIS